MRLLFICSSLEPGRDGVGDYTRRLACELIRLQHQVTAIALNDHQTSVKIINTQHFENINLPVLRLPAIWSASDRIAQALEWINESDPEWLSLQFVPYGYNPRGLPLSLGRQLALLGKGRKWHIMFHELWVGMSREEPLRLKLMGRLQRQLIRSLYQRLKPKVVHTQIEFYRAALSEIGIIAPILPIFSGVPIHNSFAKSQRTLSDQQSSKNSVDIVVFGLIHPGAPVCDFAREAAIYAHTHNVSVSMTIIGRGGSEQQHWAQCWQQEQLPVQLLGELPSENISAILQRATVGIGTSVFPLIEKSSSVKAMLEHGIPVICVAHPFTPERGNQWKQTSPAGIGEYKSGNLADLLNGGLSKPLPCSAQRIAQLLVDSLRDSGKSASLKL